MEPDVLYPIATVNTLVDTSFLGMDGSPSISVLEVQAGSYTAKGVDPFRTPALSGRLLISNGCEAAVPAAALLTQAFSVDVAVC